MENDIQSILKDLYMIDPELKKQEKDLEKLIEQLLKSKPDIKVDTFFIENLRRQLDARAEELSSSALKPNFMAMFNRLFYPFAGGILATVLVVAVIFYAFPKTQPGNVIMQEKAADVTDEAVPMLAPDSKDNALDPLPRSISDSSMGCGRYQ